MWRDGVPTMSSGGRPRWAGVWGRPASRDDATPGVKRRVTPRPTRLSSAAGWHRTGGNRAVSVGILIVDRKPNPDQPGTLPKHSPRPRSDSPRRERLAIYVLGLHPAPGGCRHPA